MTNPLEIEDLACDFVEREMGANKAGGNWEKLKLQKKDRARLEAWLKTVRSDAEVDAVWTAVDALVSKEWITFFNREKSSVL